MARIKTQKQRSYIQEYNKEHYKTFKVDLRIDELQELNDLLKKEGLTKAAFLRRSIQELKNSHNSHQGYDKMV